ncbi:hypothetical protein [uncultured Ilyobacter sp.]|uniref:hypothetical protein n=1 Tax=uncultured Ilyobacter sp. TaxID=544433 RepID=UPI0029C76B7A|nr:hypothetical protein [uncultured Ilyobacter sp.]
MLRRVLILFGSELNTENLLKTGKALKENYNCEIKGLYVRDLRKHEIIPPSVEGLVVDPSSRYIVEEWEKFENEQITILKDKFKSYFDENNLIVKDGVTPDTTLEELKGFDLLVLGKGERISPDLKFILKNHYKPIIIVSQEPIKFDRVMIANDKSFKINKSFFRFMSIFEEVKEFDSYSVGLEDEVDNSFVEYLKGSDKVIRMKESQGEEIDILLEEAEKHSLLIMGNLTHSYLVEKITGHIGVKLIESLKIPIFIA